MLAVVIMDHTTESGLSDVPLEQLLKELPVEDSDLVPLTVLVERITNNAYQTIQSLSDTLPSLPSDAKRVKIFRTALELRRLFIKLLVIVRWSKDVDLFNRVRNVVALLVEQQWAHEDVFSGLTQVRKIMPNARISDADFVTAIDVLRTGTYRRLPSCIKDSAVSPKPIDNEEALHTLANLDNVLQIRFTCSDYVPMGLRLQCIQDGKAYLEAPDLYKMCLTVSGPEEHDRWWLLDFEFLDKLGQQESLVPNLTEPFLEHVLESAELILSSQYNKEDQSTLMRLHDMLEQEALQRQLHILHHQTQRMAQFNWGKNIRYSLDPMAHILEVYYWVSHSEGMKDKTKLQGRLGLQIVSQPLKGQGRILSDILSGNQSPIHQNNIQVQWHIDPSLQIYLSSKEKECKLECLDMETLLLKCISMHTLALMKHLKSDVQSHEGLGAGNPSLCRLCTHNDSGYGPRYSLELRLSDTVHVMMYIPTISGKIGLRLLDRNENRNNMILSLSQSQNATLQRMADQIQADLSSFADTLFTFRLQCLTRSLQLQISWLRLPCSTSIALRTEELKKLSLQNGRPLLYVPLGIVPGYYLMLYFAPDQQLGMAMVLIASVIENGKALQVINSVKWLEKTYLSLFIVSGASLINRPIPPEGDSTAKDRIRTEELELALNYCLAIVVYSHLEEQLRLKLVPFTLVGGTTSSPSPPTSGHDPLLPSLCVQSKKLLPSFEDLVSPNMSLQLCDWWLPSKRRVVISLKVRLNGEFNMEEVQLYDGMVLNLQTGILTFSCYDLTAALIKFQQSWDQIARMCTLINTSTIWNQSDFHVSLESLALQQVKFVYGPEGYGKDHKRYTIQVTFEKMDRANPARYTLEFGLQTNDKNHNERKAINPHQHILKILERNLNSLDNNTDIVWQLMFQVRTSKIF